MVVALVVGSLVRGQIRDYHHGLGGEKGHNLCTPIGSPQSILEIYLRIYEKFIIKVLQKSTHDDSLSLSLSLSLYYT